MPHVEIKYSNDLKFNPKDLFDVIEATINKLDNTAGACKSRGYPTTIFKHTHLIVVVSLLIKPNRDQTFTNQLIQDLTNIIKQRLNQPCYFSLEIYYNGNNYFTTEF
ncbi:hypothetical protein ACFX5K_04105 [Rickettsiales bacterium LUAb2]